MPVSPPLSTTESGTATLVRPTNTLEFNGADFTVTGSGDKATISIDSTGTGAALTDTYIGFGNASNLLTGSANFTFTDESGGTGPTVLLTGDKPIINIQDDTAATDYYTEFQKSGSALYIFNKDSAGTNIEQIRLNPGSIVFNDDGEDIDFRSEASGGGDLLWVDAGRSAIGIGTQPDSGVERLHVMGTAADASDPLVRFESTDDGTTKAPILEFYRNSASPADSDYIGAIHFSGNNVSGTKTEYGRILSQINDVSAATEDSAMYFQIYEMGTPRTIMTLHKSEVVFNENQRNIDFRVESDNNSNMILVDANQDNIGIGTSPNSNTVLHISDDGSKANTVRIESTDNDTAVGPVLDMRRNNADGTAGVGDTIGVIQFAGLDSGGGSETYNRFVCEIKDPDTTQAVGRMKFMGLDDGSELEYMRYEAGAITFNEIGVNIDFRIEGENDGSLFRTDASDDSVGIGTVPDINTAKLQVTDDGSKSFTLLLESTDDDAAGGPVLALWRHSPGPVAGDDLGTISWYFENSDGDRHIAGRLRSEVNTTTAGAEDTRLYFSVMKAGTEVQTVAMVHSEVVINQGSHDINFRAESDGNANMFNVDAGLNMVSVSASPTSGGATFQVPDNTISSYCNVNAVRSDAVAQQNMTNADCQGQTWVNDSSTAWTIFLPEGGIKGQWFDFLSTDGNMTITCQSGDTLNGVAGTTSLTRSTDYAVYRVICYANGKWALNNPE